MNEKNILKFLIKRVFIIFLFFTPTAFAECNFKTGEYLEELANPSYIKKIEIKVPKYRKYIINFVKIKAQHSEVIPTSLKKTFKSKILI